MSRLTPGISGAHGPLMMRSSLEARPLHAVVRRCAMNMRHPINGVLMQIKIDDLQGAEIYELLQEHLRDMRLHSPPESVHALDIEGLRKPGITFWTVWEGAELLGCGALKELDAQHGEIKSMRTASSHLRKGVAKNLLQHILAEAKRRGYSRLSLETGSMAAFEPARRLYAGFGFTYCAPFADYIEDPNSVFMTREL
jgi:putative acetyltransferase